MRIQDFPGCCTAKIVLGFGGTGTASWEIRPKGNRTIESELKEFLEREIVRYKNYAVFVATTNTQQVLANKVLAEVGFVPTNPLPKNQHRETDLIVWHCPLKEHPLNQPKPIAVKVAKKAPVRPRDAMGRFIKKPVNTI